MASQLCRVAMPVLTRAPRALSPLLGVRVDAVRAAAVSGATRAAVDSRRALTIEAHTPWFTDLITSQEERPITVNVGPTEVKINTEALRGVADGAALIAQGDSCVLGTVLVSPNFTPRRDVRFEVEYRERACAFGKIPTTGSRREGQPKDREVLVVNLIEKVFRPLLAPGYTHDTTLECLTLASNSEGDPTVMAINAVSSALAASNVPWAGPVGAVRLSLNRDGTVVLNPARSQMGAAATSLLYVGNSKGPVLLSGEGLEVAEEDLVRLMSRGHESVQGLIEAQRGLRAGAPAEDELPVATADPSAVATIESLVSEQIEGILRKSGSIGSLRASRALEDLKSQLRQRLTDLGSFRFDHNRQEGSGAVSPSDIESAFSGITVRVMQRLLFEEGLRPGGLGLHDALPLTVKKSFLPGVHGSSLVGLGGGQVLTTVTVGRDDEKAFTDHIMDWGTFQKKPVIVQYDAAASRQLSRSNRFITRREQLFTAAFMEAALKPVLPKDSEFPFAIRINVEVLGAVWVSDTPAVTGASLALHEGAVPVSKPVVGVSVGLVSRRTPAALRTGFDATATEEPPHELISDVTELEQSLLDAGLQLAGTRDGVTAVHLACEDGAAVSLERAIEAVRFAKDRRLKMAEAMERHLEEAEGEAARPVAMTRAIKKDHIGKLIGPQGATIKKLSADSNSVVIVNDGGYVHAYSPSPAAHQRLTADLDAILPSALQVGQAYRARVVALKDYGAFLELPNKEQALLHISEIEVEKTKSVTDVFKLDDMTEVVFLGMDAKGNMKLSRRELLRQRQQQQEQQQAQTVAAAS